MTRSLNTSMASRASHFLVGMTIQGVFNRDAGPFAASFYFAAIVADFAHLNSHTPAYSGHVSPFGPFGPLPGI
jgi:hypothetical protein